MTIDPKLMKAILAMDSYNRGYNAGIVFGDNPDDSEAINGVTKIGNLTVYRSLGNADAKSIGFYAIAYQDNSTGETVISYRGTDEDITPLADDVVHAYGIGTAAPYLDQAEMAFEFYKSVAAALNGGSPADPYAANISVTGHSMGGGLAGLVGANDNAPQLRTMTLAA